MSHPGERIAVDPTRAKRLFGFVGKRGAGKTTLMAGVAEALCTLGYTVSAIYCSYAEEGAARHDEAVRLLRDAGCREVIWPEVAKTVAIRGCVGQLEQQLERTLSHMAQVDIVLVEGFEDASLPKLEVFRASLDVPFVSPCCRCLAALATDAHVRYCGITLDLNVPQTVADFIITYLGLPHACRRPAAGSRPG